MFNAGTIATRINATVRMNKGARRKRHTAHPTPPSPVTAIVRAAETP